MTAVATAFDALDDAARRRVLNWAADKFGVAVREAAGTRDGARARLSNGDAGDPDEGAMPGDEPERVYDHFADLYAAAAPADKAERVLVASYWFQRVLGRDTFQAFELNKELRHLGHYVDHIAEALASCISRKPQLVLQVRKSSKSQQGRKTYKLSAEGIKAVEAKIADRS